MGGRRVKEAKTEEVSQPPKEGKRLKVKSEPREEKETKPIKKAAKVRVKKLRGKKYVAAATKREAKEYPLVEAVAKVKELSYAKFDASVDAHINLELEKADQQIRTFVALPHGRGKEIKILVFADGKLAKDALSAGADTIGDETLIEKIGQSRGLVEPFDVVVATPTFMSKLAKIARILGPKGLMPTPKTGTVTEDPAKVVGELKKGRVEIKTEAKPVIHVSIGRVSFPDEHLVENFKAIAEELQANRAKIKSANLAPTMGSSVKIALDSIT